MQDTSTQPTSADAILDAARIHVIFDGWSETTFAASLADANVSPADARALFPRGAIDLAAAFHFAGDAALARRLAESDLGAMRYSERVAFAVMERLRIAAPDREVVRRSAAFFALPIHGATASKCMWHTADTIWTALGDTSTDYNWYSKRLTLSGVYASSLLYWLGDDSADFAATSAFVDRRIGDVMSIEKGKAQLRKSPLYGLFKRGPGRLLDAVRAPGLSQAQDLPGTFNPASKTEA